MGYFPITRRLVYLNDCQTHELLLSKFPEILNDFIDAEVLKERNDVWLGQESFRGPAELQSILRYEQAPISIINPQQVP